MEKNPSPRKCPSCQNAFVPWRAWLISRWSSIACPYCAAKLNRKLDVQFFAVMVPLSVALVGAFTLFLASPALGLAIGSVSLVVAWAVDVLTIKLVVAGKWAGWSRGYEA